MVGVSDLLSEARALAAGPRRILGITGPPGAGKSTLARALVRSLGPRAVLVGMDGFHRVDEELVALGRRDRKGAPDTFDVDAYVATLGRLRRAGETVHAPDFDRVTDAPVPGAIAVPPTVALVVTEGNYLLVGEAPWAAVRPLLDVCWYVDVDDSVRLPRLVDRHHTLGKSRADAELWALGSDRANADRVARTRARADRCVEGTEVDTLVAALEHDEARRPERPAGED